MSRLLLCRILACVVFLVPSLSLGQGLLVDDRPDHRFRLPRPIIVPHPRTPRPQPPQSYRIQELAVNATLKDQVAKVQVSQSFENTGSRQMEVSFVFPLPYDGAVDRMTFMLDGKEYPARLLSAKEARGIYEGYVRRNQDPALLEWIGTGMFKTSVFPVPPGAKRTVMMQYSQICPKTNGLTEWLFPLSTAKYTSKAVEKVAVNVTIQSQVSIKNVYSPTHSIELKRPANNVSRVSYTIENTIPSSDFRLVYDVGDQPVGASVMSYRPDSKEEGYFLLLVSPDIQRTSESPLAKTVVFVMDRSGSMSGTKIEQAKGALKFVLNNLNDGDLFNIIAYDSSVESFQPELQRYNTKTRQQALGFVEGIYAGGSTNIDGALESALTQLQDDKRPNYIVFLTDGLPTAGERREMKIVANASAANKVRARIMSLGVGYDVNSKLLDKLAQKCYGQSQYVRPNEDIEEHVAKLYQRIDAPAMTDLQVTFDLEGFPVEKGSPVSRVYPRDAYDLFAGDQLVLVGRYKQPGAAKVVVSGKVDGAGQSFDFPANFVMESKDDSNSFIEKLWAVRRIGEIIDEIDMQGKNQELVNELVALATRHGILTPYTSFLADEMANIRDFADTRRRAGEALDQLSEESGRMAFGQRLVKQNLKRARTAPGMGAGAFDTYGAAEGDSGSSQGGFRSGGGGMGGAGMPGAGMPAGRGRGSLNYATPTLEAKKADGVARAGVVRKVLNVGRKTFFWRNERWEDSTLTDELIKKVKKIKRYSPEYFDLSTRFGKDAAKYLAVEETMVVVLKGQAYEF